MVHLSVASLFVEAIVEDEEPRPLLEEDALAMVDLSLACLGLARCKALISRGCPFAPNEGDVTSSQGRRSYQDNDVESAVTIRL